MKLGRLYLVPIEISRDGMSTIPVYNISIIHKVKYYIVERARTARRFISRTSPPHPISDIEFLEMDDDGVHLQQCIMWLKSGYDVGVMSESGMPGIADPGNDLVALAHLNGITVVPLVGPNSIMLALISSGLNGQNFAFNGYLPIKDHQLEAELKRLENLIFKHKQTQIFIETPYRNDRLFSKLKSSVNKNIKLCIAKDITGQEEMIKTLTILKWQKKDIEIGKWPTIFLLGM